MRGHLNANLSTWDGGQRLTVQPGGHWEDRQPWEKQKNQKKTKTKTGNLCSLLPASCSSHLYDKPPGLMSAGIDTPGRTYLSLGSDKWGAAAGKKARALRGCIKLMGTKTPSDTIISPQTHTILSITAGRKQSKQQRNMAASCEPISYFKVTRYEYMYVLWQIQAHLL